MNENEFENLRQRDEYFGSMQKLLGDLKNRAENSRKSEFAKPGNKEKLRRQYIDMLGYPLNTYAKEANINVKTEPLIAAGGEDMAMTRYQLEVMPGFWFYGILYEHKKRDKSKKNALVIAQHGGGGTPELVGSLVFDSANYNHMVKRVISESVTVFAPQLLLWDAGNFGSEGYDRIETDKKLKQFGGSITGLEVYCIMRCIDYFAGLDNIDENRIGMVGLSYGGMYTVYAAAADTRIKVALSSCWFNDRLKHNWFDWVYFNQANLFFDAEVSSLILPRKLYIEIGKDDELFDPADAKADIIRLREYAENENCADSLVIKIFDGLHELDKSDDGINFFIGNL
jgi:dienelactone hydrolase